MQNKKLEAKVNRYISQATDSLAMYADMIRLQAIEEMLSGEDLMTVDEIVDDMRSLMRKIEDLTIEEE